MAQVTHLEVLEETLQTPSQLGGDQPLGKFLCSGARSASFSVLYKIINWWRERDRGLVSLQLIA